MEVNLIVYFETWADPGTWLIESVELGTVSTPYSGNMKFFEVKERLKKFNPEWTFTNFG